MERMFELRHRPCREKRGQANAKLTCNVVNLMELLMSTKPMGARRVGSNM